jgi:uncharacterized membrane protein YfcA
MTDTTTPASIPARHRRRDVRWKVAAWVAAYAVLGVFAHLVPPEYLDDLTLLAYAVAEVGGAAFLARYVRTDWRAHPWGRHVMAFMVCMEVIFTLSLSRRLLGDWVGLYEALFLASVTFAGIVWWRYRLLVGGRSPGRPADD